MAREKARWFASDGTMFYNREEAEAYAATLKRHDYEVDFAITFYGTQKVTATNEDHAREIVENMFNEGSFSLSMDNAEFEVRCVEEV